MSITFHYPFNGRPTAIPRIGAFSFTPATYLKLLGVSLRSLAAEAGAINEYRRIERLAGQSHVKERLALKAIRNLHEKLKLSGAPPNVIEDMQAMAAGCTDIRQRIGSMPLIQQFFRSMGLQMNEWQRRHCYLIVLERSGIVVQQLLNVGDMPGAVDYITSHPLLGNLIWPEAAEVLRKATNERATHPLTAAMCLDAQLGWLAACDADFADENAAAPQFNCVIPSRHTSGLNPTSLLFHEFKRRLGARSMSAILDKASVLSESEIPSTLDRWSSGRHLPAIDTMQALMSAHGLLEPQDILYRQYTATKIINLLGYIGQSLSAIAHKSNEPKAMWPWPGYSFGHSEFETWATARYHHWFRYLHEKSGVIEKLAQASRSTGTS